jgi:hypothetical protein
LVTTRLGTGYPLLDERRGRVYEQFGSAPKAKVRAARRTQSMVGVRLLSIGRSPPVSHIRAGVLPAAGPP